MSFFHQRDLPSTLRRRRARLSTQPACVGLFGQNRSSGSGINGFPEIQTRRRGMASTAIGTSPWPVINNQGNALSVPISFWFRNWIPHTGHLDAEITDTGISRAPRSLAHPRALRKGSLFHTESAALAIDCAYLVLINDRDFTLLEPLVFSGRLVFLCAVHDGQCIFKTRTPMLAVAGWSPAPIGYN